MDFSNLNINDKGTSKTSPVPIKNIGKTTVRFGDLDIEDNKPKRPKISREELYKIEPGNKVPIAQYQQIGTYCDECEDITSHAHNPEKKKLICLKCKTVKTYGNK